MSDEEEGLRRAGAEASVGRLALAIAHELGTHLTVLNAYAGILAEEVPPDDPRAQAVAQVVRNGERAAALTRRLLEAAAALGEEPVADGADGDLKA